MKRILALFALLLLAQPAFSQIPRWRFALPAPTQPNTAAQSVTVLANDGNGGAVFLITESREAPEITGGAYAPVADHIIWLDRNGRLLHKITRVGPFLLDSYQQYNRPIVRAISPTAVQIQLNLVAGSEEYVTRRLVRTVRGVVSRDITPPVDERPAAGFSFVSTADIRGYFTIKSVPKDEFGYVRNDTHIVRYTP